MFLLINMYAIYFTLLWCHLPDVEPLCCGHHGQFWVPYQRRLHPGASSPWWIHTCVGRVWPCCLVGAFSDFATFYSPVLGSGKGGFHLKGSQVRKQNSLRLTSVSQLDNSELEPRVWAEAGDNPLFWLDWCMQIQSSTRRPLSSPRW